MLVLSRRLGQRFQIGEDVHITIVKVDRNSVRIGIEAPADVMIRREEILEEDEVPQNSHKLKADAANSKPAQLTGIKTADNRLLTDFANPSGFARCEYRFHKP
jgi:carbon storage regulator